MNRRGLFKGLFGATAAVAGERYLHEMWWNTPVGYTRGYGGLNAGFQPLAGGMSANIKLPTAEEESYEMIDYMLTPTY